LDKETSESNIIRPDFAAYGPSPLAPKNLLSLFFRPTRFFSTNLALNNTLDILLVIWCLGINSAMERLNKILLKEEIRENAAGTSQLVDNAFMQRVLESWAHYWAWVLGIGVIGGFIIWLINGWWYKVRIIWSGHKNPDPRTARLVYAYSTLVETGPAIISVLLLTIFYDNYLDWWRTHEFDYTPFFVIFLFWSLVTSFKGVITCFDVSKTKAMVWFLILPTIVYIVAFVALTGLIAYVLETGIS
jgi:hypothetical protein